MRLRVKMVIIAVNVIAMICGMLVFSVAPHYSTKEKLEHAKTLPLEKDKNPKVTKLMEDFFDAKFTKDRNALKKCVSNINKDEYSDENIEKEFALVEEIKNIDVYTIDGYYDDSYVTVVYQEIKLKDMDVVAPSVLIYYVSTVDDKLVISDYEDELAKKYFENAISNPEVEKLATQVTKETEELAKQYPEYDYLLKLLSGEITPTPAPTPTPTPEPKSTNADASFG